MGLMDSLGLDNVEADPNATPDGKYPGEVMKSDLVFVQSKNTVSHVITYLVTEGDMKGKQRPEWFELGTGPQYDDKGKIIGVDTITMSANQKPWYKKRLMDLGVPENKISELVHADLVGRQVTFGTKKNGAYINVSFAELRGDSLAQFGNAPAEGVTTVTPNDGDSPARKASLI